MRSACASALWSIQTMTFCSSSPSGPTETGSPFASTTASEHVASKPIPRTVTSDPALTIARRTEAQTADQMSVVDCWTKSACGFQVRICWLACPSISPSSEKTPARALPVPTSMPMTASRVTPGAPA